MPQAKKALFKGQLFLDHLLQNFKAFWKKKASINEQTLRFQGKHLSKLLITYNRVGNGF